MTLLMGILPSGYSRTSSESKETRHQGKEMGERKQLSERRGVAVFFANPHSPWQRR